MTKFIPLLLSALWVIATFPGNVFTSLSRSTPLLYLIQPLTRILTVIDRLGRRTFMLIGLAGTMVSNILSAALQAQYLGTSNVAGQKAAIFAIFLFILFWSSFLDASQFFYLSEIFPRHIRAEGMALGMGALYLADIIVLVAGPIALDKIKWKFFLVFIIPTAVEWLCVFFFFPETKQRSLEDINAAFSEDVAVHYFGATNEEQQEYLKAMAAVDIVHHDGKGRLVNDSGDEKTENQVLHSESV
jgi:MFS family permease